MGVSFDVDRYMLLSTIEHIIVSLSLSLVIAKYYPAVHNNIISMVTRTEHQSLYWGTVIVFNFFTYSLLFLVGRGLHLTAICGLFGRSWKAIVSVLILQEIVINFILFVGALIASLRDCGGTGVPIPRGMTKLFVYASFFFTCFCCCVGCYPQCKTKPLRVRIMFSVMSFIYHIIMDVISITFLLFIQYFRTSIVTMTLLSLSMLVFLVLFASYSLFTLFRGRSSGLHQCVRCFGGTFILAAVFSVLVFIIVIYIIIVLSLNLQGVSGIVSGLIPSIALSSISLYIKKRLLSKGTNSSSHGLGQCQTEYGTNIGGTNGRDDDERMLLP